MTLVTRGNVGVTPQPQGKREIGERSSPEPHVVAMSFHCVHECVNVVENECGMYV